MSEPQMPQWSTSTSTSPGPGRGTGRSSTSTTPGRSVDRGRHRLGQSGQDGTSPLGPGPVGVRPAGL